MKIEITNGVETPVTKFFSASTPETDAITSVGLENADRECVPAEFARKLERERDEAREAGWKLAMQAVWDRLPMPAYANDPMEPREVAKLIEFVRSQKEETK